MKEHSKLPMPPVMTQLHTLPLLSAMANDAGELRSEE
jgi:hypothetical protein